MSTATDAAAPLAQVAELMAALPALRAAYPAFDVWLSAWTVVLAVADREARRGLDVREDVTQRDALALADALAQAACWTTARTQWPEVTLAERIQARALFEHQRDAWHALRALRQALSAGMPAWRSGRAAPLALTAAGRVSLDALLLDLLGLPSLGLEGAAALLNAQARGLTWRD